MRRLAQAVSNAEAPREHEDLGGRQKEDQKGADPKIQRVESLQVLAEIKHECRTEACDEAEDRHRLLPADSQNLLQKRNARLQHGERARDRREEQQEEKTKTKNRAERHVVKNQRKNIEAEREGSHARHTGHSKEGKRCGERDQAT